MLGRGVLAGSPSAIPPTPQIPAPHHGPHTEPRSEPPPGNPRPLNPSLAPAPSPPPGPQTLAPIATSTPLPHPDQTDLRPTARSAPADPLPHAGPPPPHTRTPGPAARSAPRPAPPRPAGHSQLRMSEMKTARPRIPSPLDTAGIFGPRQRPGRRAQEERGARTGGRQSRQGRRGPRTPRSAGAQERGAASPQPPRGPSAALRAAHAHARRTRRHARARRRTAAPLRRWRARVRDAGSSTREPARGVRPPLVLAPAGIREEAGRPGALSSRPRSRPGCRRVLRASRCRTNVDSAGDTQLGAPATPAAGPPGAGQAAESGAQDALLHVPASLQMGTLRLEKRLHSRTVAAVLRSDPRGPVRLFATVALMAPVDPLYRSPAWLGLGSAPTPRDSGEQMALPIAPL